MPSEPDANALYMLRRATERGLDLEALYRCAVASGRDELVPAGEERVAGVDELLVRSLREFVLLGELAAFASFHWLESECRRPLARASARLLRLLDCALRARPRRRLRHGGAPTRPLRRRWPRRFSSRTRPTVGRCQSR
jgi:hypothetical protein